MAKDIYGLKEWVIHFLREQLSPDLLYHNVQHTLDVWIACKVLADHEGLDDTDLALVEAGALFHDTGFVKEYFRNEPIGAELAAEHLPKFGFTQDEIKVVKQLVLATAYPGNPKNLLEMIICDGDLEYLGRPDFKEVSSGLYKEFIDQEIIKTKGDWLKLQVNFLTNHQFHTATARRLWGEGQIKNLNEAKSDYAVYENTLPPTE